MKYTALLIPLIQIFFLELTAFLAEPNRTPDIGAIEDIILFSLEIALKAVINWLNLSVLIDLRLAIIGVAPTSLKCLPIRNTKVLIGKKNRILMKRTL